MNKLHWALLLGALSTGQVVASDELSGGAGLFSGESGEFSLLKHSEKKVKRSDLKNLDAKKEFQLFKEWKLEKSKNTSDYQEFILWLEYQEVMKTN